MQNKANFPEVGRVSPLAYVEDVVRARRTAALRTEATYEETPYGVTTNGPSVQNKANFGAAI